MEMQKSKGGLWAEPTERAALFEAFCQDFDRLGSRIRDVRVEVLDHGSVTLLDFMGTDSSIARDARTSYGRNKQFKTTLEDEKLIRYLMRHRHTSPFEMAEMKFYIEMPIFVARQWVRHRTGSMNEMSGRYVELPEIYHMPETWRGQAKINKQGSEGDVTHSRMALAFMQGSNPDYGVFCEEAAFREYRSRLAAGVSREQARECLPLSTYTGFVWKQDLHNLLHLLHLRMDSHAQAEIRAYANVIAVMVEVMFPLTWRAFSDYVLNAVTFSRQELTLLKTAIRDKAVNEGSMGNNEFDEFLSKLKKVSDA